MAERETLSVPKRCAVVTGANKGLGLEICRQLAAYGGVFVVLTARDEKRGIEALENLKHSGLSDVVFHQLDLLSTTSIANLAEFLTARFGKLDILVNNAAISGVTIDEDILKAKIHEDPQRNLFESLIGSKEGADECLQANYYGTKSVTEALIPLLLLADAGRIINMSATVGQLKNITHRWAKEILSDVEGLTKDRIEEVLKVYLKDFKDGISESKGWSKSSISAYIISKAALNAYSRIIAKEFPKLYINCVCPGYVSTEMNANTGIFTVEQGVEGPVWLALLPDGGPTGLFFSQRSMQSF